MNVISSFLGMFFDLSLKSRQGMDADMTTSKECHEVLDLHNKTRDIYDLVPLRLSENCCLVAQAHAVWMANSQSISHLGFSFFGPTQRLAIVGEEPSRIGECISFSAHSESSPLMKSWFASETHRAVILGKFTQFGLGVAKSTDGFTFWCGIYIDDLKSDDSPRLSMSDSLIDTY